MALSLTCRRCDIVLTAETEEELAVAGQEHAHQHGHTRPLSHEHVLARIRRHNRERSNQRASE